MLIPAAWVLLVGLVLWIAPNEKTLGNVIKFVYFHVALVWTGMVLLYLAGGLGIWVLIQPRPTVTHWMRWIAWVGLGFMAAAFLASLPAQILAWGGIAWQEPRTAAILRLLAVAVIVHVANTWLQQPRLEGLFNTLLAGLMAWMLSATPLQLHPRDPIGTSASLAIPLTFYGLTAICLAGAVWLIFTLGRRQNPA
ncbi:MAG: hypothetical protein D6768_18950 [Chloroflexi bacterium]|nr:MAG: hypothetical protein D6768_18950 [Chloroflexota bacterium]